MEQRFSKYSKYLTIKVGHRFINFSKSLAIKTCQTFNKILKILGLLYMIEFFNNYLRAGAKGS